jgi:putative Holliday junction resolvase
VRVLGVDVGERRIGLAISDVSATLARPLRTIQASGALPARIDALVSAISELEQEADGLGAVVVGLPRSLDGRAHEQTGRVRDFVDALRGRTRLPIRLQDERLTSREAESRLALRAKDWRMRKPKLDAAAAAVILQDHLNAATRNQESE